MKLYKLTNKQGQTRNSTQWGEGVTHTLPACDDPQLCSNKVLHAYTDLNLSLVLNSIHADISNNDLRIWEAEGEQCVVEWDKCGTFALTTVKEVPLPAWFVGIDTRLMVLVLFAQKCKEEAARAEWEWEAEEAARAEWEWEARAAREAEAAARAAREARAEWEAEAAARAAAWAARAARAARAAARAEWEAAWAEIDFSQLLQDAINEVTA